MSLYDKMQEAWNNADVDAWNDLHHDDFEFTRHQSGRVIKKGDNNPEEMKEFMKAMKQERRRCIYENDDLLVTHAFVTYGSGDKEALMAVYLKKDGLLWRLETGATELK